MSIICGGCDKDISPGPGNVIRTDDNCPVCGRCLQVVGLTINAERGQYGFQLVGGGSGGAGGGGPANKPCGPIFVGQAGFYTQTPEEKLEWTCIGGGGPSGSKPKTGSNGP
jgi:hypothetical protein